MRRTLLLGLLIASACGGAKSTEPAPATAIDAPALSPAPTDAAPKAATVTVQMTAATLGDDCGGAPPSSPPQKGASQTKADSKEEELAPSGKAKSKRRCDQTSMQLSIGSPSGAQPATIAITEVEIFDDAGTSLGVVRASAPRKWSDEGGYVDWDQQVAPGTELAVSYALSEPDWSKVPDRFGKTFVVKAKVSVGGAQRAVQADVKVEARANPAVIVKT